MGTGHIPQPGTQFLDGTTHSVGAMINPYNPESLASLSATSQISAPPAILGNTASVLNPGYMPPERQRDIEGAVFSRTVEGRQHVYNFGLHLEATVESPANQDNTIQRLEQLNQTVTAALQAGRTVASPAVAAAAAEAQQLNFFPELNNIQSLFQTRDERMYRAAQEPTGLALRQWGNVQRHAMSSMGLGGQLTTSLEVEASLPTGMENILSLDRHLADQQAVIQQRRRRRRPVIPPVLTPSREWHVLYAWMQWTKVKV